VKLSDLSGAWVWASERSVDAALVSRQLPSAWSRPARQTWSRQRQLESAEVAESAISAVVSSGSASRYCPPEVTVCRRHCRPLLRRLSQQEAANQFEGAPICDHVGGQWPAVLDPAGCPSSTVRQMPWTADVRGIRRGGIPELEEEERPLAHTAR